MARPWSKELLNSAVFKAAQADRAVKLAFDFAQLRETIAARVEKPSSVAPSPACLTVSFSVYSHDFSASPILL